MSKQDKLEQNFASAKKEVTTPETGGGTENSMLSKEARRLIMEASAFERSKSQWQKWIMKACIGVASASVILNIVLGVAISIMTPLKTVEPYVITVDRVNANVTISSPLDKPVVSQGEQVDQFFVAEYVRAREGYDWGLAQRMYDQVKSYSVLNGSVWNEYDKFIKSQKSPLIILADRSRVVVDITSITLDAKTSSATVRFTKTVMGADGRPSTTIPATSWIATLSYEYPNPKLKLDERRLNPLGMKIPSYQIVQEQGRG